MEIFLVTSSDYDYSLIDSSWATEQEALDRIAYAQSLGNDHVDYVPYAYNFQVTKLTLGEVRGEMERYQL